MFRDRRNLLLPAAVLLFLGSAATRDKPEIARQILERLQAHRVQQGLATLEQRPALEAVALRRARQIVIRAPQLRLSQETPIEDLLQDAGILRYHRAREHVELQQGYADAAGAAMERWQTQESTWSMMTDPRMDAVGLATVVGEDGWLVLVTLLVQDLEIPTDLGAWEARVVAEVNEIRSEHHLPPQLMSAELARIAKLHSEDMARRDFFAHQTPEGHDLEHRILGRNLQYVHLAENIGRNRGADDPLAKAIEGWMASRPHRKNILTEGFMETGVGIAIDEKGMFYFTQLFLDPGRR